MKQTEKKEEQKKLNIHSFFFWTKQILQTYMKQNKKYMTWTNKKNSIHEIQDNRWMELNEFYHHHHWIQEEIQNSWEKFHPIQNMNYGYGVSVCVCVPTSINFFFYLGHISVKNNKKKSTVQSQFLFWTMKKSQIDHNRS